MAKATIVLIPENTFKSMDIDFTSVKLSSQLPIGLVSYAINGMPPDDGRMVRMDTGSKVFYSQDLEDLLNRQKITIAQKQIFERFAPEIVEFVHAQLEKERTRKERMLACLQEYYDARWRLDDIMIEGKHSLVHQVDE